MMRSRQTNHLFVTFKSALVFLSAIFLFHLVMITFVIREQDTQALFNNLFEPIDTLLSVLGLCWAAHRSATYSRRVFIAWGFLAAAQLSWFMGDVTWAVLEVGLGQSPFPSIADAPYLIYYPLFMAGVLLLPARRPAADGWFRLILDMGIIVSSAFLMFWYFWIGPLMTAGDTDLVTLVLSVAYPVCDLLMLSALFLLVANRIEKQARGPVILLAAGMGIQIITDAIFGYQSIEGTYFVGAPLDMGYVAAAFLAGLAGVMQADTIGKQTASSGRQIVGVGTEPVMRAWIVYLPYILLVAAYFLLVVSYDRDIHMRFTTLIIWVGIIIFLVLIRQVMTIQDNIRLLEEQRRAGHALRESEEKYRVVVEHAQEGILVIQDGLLKYLNPTVYTITGYVSDELLDKSFDDYIYPEDRVILLGEYERKVSGDRRTVPSTFRIINKNTSLKWLRGTGVLIEWEGRPALLIYVRDITDEKKVEEEREERNLRVIRYQATLLELTRLDFSNLIELFKEITEVVAHTLPADRVGVWLFSDDGRELICHDLYLRHDDSHETGQRFELEEHPRYFRALRHSRILAADAAADDPRTNEFLHEYLIPQGVTAMMDVPIRLMGEIVGVLCHEHTGGVREWLLEEQEFAASVADTVSLAMEAFEHKKSQTALRESEEKYRTFFENSFDSLFTVDLKGNFTSVNRATEALSGYRRDELIGRNFRDFVTPQVAERIFTVYNALFRTEIPVSGIQYSITRKDGQTRTVEGYVAILRKDDAVVGFQGTLTDITDRLKLEQQLIQSQKMDAVGTMAGGIAHNFNNIMVGIMGYSEFLLMEKKEGDPDYKALKIIHEGTVRASELTKQMLNLSRGGRYSLSSINLNLVIQRVMPLVGGTFDKSIDVTTHLDPDLMTVDGDAGQIEQCILNLSINARDAMPDGGRLIIETKNQALDDDFVRSHLGAVAGPHVVVTVTDTGTGIAPEIRPHIFEPFFTTKEQTGGTGMGLATVYGIVRNHNGIITVYSEMGSGSTFKLYFPATTAKIIDPVERREVSQSKRGAVILLIDDEPVVREIWGDFLAQEGYRIITADNGMEGIERYQEHHDIIDLVILDIIMPKLGGKETLSAIKKINPSVKVLITSGYSENGQAGDIVNLGIEGFIQKPTQLVHLKRVIADILQK